jgi:signal transduction histidine kinase
VTKPVLTAILAVVASTVIRLLLDPLLGTDAPMLIYVLGVSLASVQAGVAAGVLATLISIPVGALFFIEPRAAFLPTRTEDYVRLVVFALEGLFIAYATGQLRGQVDEKLRLTEQVRRQNQALEAEVERRTAELQASNAALETFAHTISHDLRAPLRSIRGFSEILDEDFAATLPEEARGYTARIAAAAHRLEELVANLLAYTRLGRQGLSEEPVSLDRVVPAVLADMAGDIRHAQGAVTIETSPLGVVRGHPDTIALMVSNLVSNALKFVQPGTHPRVAIATRRSGDYLRLSVRDEGIGVPAEDQRAIFAPFERLHSHQTYAGTGLGLALVARGAERMGGRYGVTSSGSSGSEFWVELPATGSQDL